MAQTDTPHTTDPANSTTAVPAEDDAALRKRLLSRIAVAGVVIAGLLGSLAVYDSLNKPQAPALPKMAAAPEPVTVPETPVVPAAAEPAAPSVDEKAAEASAEESRVASAEPAVVAVVPERTDTPLAPSLGEKPLKAAKPVTAPATARSAAIKPTPPAAAPLKPDAQREIARVMPERSTAARAVAPASRPLTQAGETAHRFLVQVGVFSNHANAEELVARLQQAGIPAQIESRVQVGPFASRAEVDAARAKLKSLGMDDGMLVRR
ncbi:MAG: SPOR domain-containing protein [Rhodocyclaceae bacterium]|nr:SPOR domain-containing protein [Rhodocyclaceae bacterium]